MKTKLVPTCATVWLSLAILTTFYVAPPATAFAQPTAFNYQGRLTDGAGEANGLYDFEFALFPVAVGDTALAGPLTTNAVVVSNGLFTVTLDFGPGVFAGPARWLEIGVRSNGVGGFTRLSPRTEITPTPYAIHAFSVDSAGLSGTFNEGVAFDNPANLFVGTFTGDGAALTNVDAASLGGLSAGSFWQLGGNAGTTAGVNFFGTTDNQPLELKVNNIRGWRLEPTVDDALRSGIVNVVGGSPANVVLPGVYGATIGGGGALSYVGVSRPNRVDEDFATIGGGLENTIQFNAHSSTIGGGWWNRIQTNAYSSAIGGGFNNTIQPNAYSSTIGGGATNTIEAAADQSTIGGGVGNTIQSGAHSSTIGGGSRNRIWINATNSTIGGGVVNWISGDYSTIGGGRLNWIQSGATDSTIGGGRQNTVQSGATNSTIGGGWFNRIQTNSSSSTIGGGNQNTIEPNASDATIGGGYYNRIEINAFSSTIGGGFANSILTNAFASTIGGGSLNQIQSGATNSTIGGGWFNRIQTNSSSSTIGGGWFNTIETNAQYATIPGGRSNTATNYAFAAGRQAKANHTGAFVWADSTGTDFTSDRANQFKVRAVGGVSIIAASSGLNPAALRAESTTGNGVVIHANQTSSDSTTVFVNRGTGDLIKGFSGVNGGNLVFQVQNDGDVFAQSFNPTSDRNAKENFSIVNPQQVLAKVAALPISEWNFKGNNIRHVGPMAQDFHAAFGLGPDDKHIATVDADGVALAAIQGLNQKLEQRLEQRETEIAELKARLEKLEQLMASQISN